MIYFAQLPTGAIKIGSSDNVRERLRTLSIEYRAKLGLLAVLPGGRKEEHAIHRQFAHLRFPKTEQFRPAPELMEFIGRPLFASTRPVAQAPRLSPQPYNLGITRREIKEMGKPFRKIPYFKTRHHMVRWLIWAGHKDIVGPKKKPDSRIDSVNIEATM